MTINIVSQSTVLPLSVVYQAGPSHCVTLKCWEGTFAGILVDLNLKPCGLVTTLINNDTGHVMICIPGSPLPSVHVEKIG